MRYDLFANLPTNLPEELVEVLAAENNNVRIVRVASTGHASPEHQHLGSPEAPS